MEHLINMTSTCYIVERVLDPQNARPLTGFNDWPTGSTKKVLFCKEHHVYADTWEEMNQHKKQAK